MGDAAETEAERYYQAYRRGAAVGLAFGVLVLGWTMAVLLQVIRPELVRGSALLIIGVFILAMLLVQVLSLGGRLWRRGAAGPQRVLRDEWTRRNWNAACRTSFFVVMWAQLPLAYFVVRVAPSSNVPPMAMLTMALGTASFFGSFLYRSRLPVDG